MGFLVALIIILLVLFIRVGVRVRTLGDLSLSVDLGLFRIPIFPIKDKNIRLSDYRIKKFRRNLEKERRKALKKRKKQLKKQSKKNAKTTAEKAKTSDQRKDSIKDKVKDIKGLIDTVYNLASTFLSRFGKHLHIKVRRLVVVVGSADAATTAVVYGGVCGAVQCFMELLDNCLHVKFTKNSEIRVIPDFTSEKASAEVDVTFSFRIWQVLDMLIRTGISYLKRLFTST